MGLITKQSILIVLDNTGFKAYKVRSLVTHALYSVMVGFMEVYELYYTHCLNCLDACSKNQVDDKMLFLILRGFLYLYCWQSICEFKRHLLKDELTMNQSKQE